MTQSYYQRIVHKAYEREQGQFGEEWQNGLRQVRQLTPLFGYFPPRWMLDFGATCAFLFARTGQERLVEEARQALLFYRAWLKELPPDAASRRPEYAGGIGPMEPVFHPSVLVPALCDLRPALTAPQLDELVSLLADTLRPLWYFPEWGGHNRAALRAAGLASAAQAFPDHAEASRWRSLADELIEESWGRWSIEDAMLYQPHWLRSLIRYAEAAGREAELRDMLQPRHHLKAMTQLISPLGILPDYGDSHWLMHSHWEWAACLEWGAAAYRDPAMKWAANRLFLGDEPHNPTVYLATVAMLGWRWCDESVPAAEPLNREDALDDLVLKKLVWRSGWDERASYACLNYRDEGDYGRAARDYLRDTLAVSAEKMHHGHADEGSFSMLVHDQTLLLHESGYREQPPDGIYRAGVYHNRLVWRRGSRPEDQGLLEFLRADGRYRPVRTERLYHTHLCGAQFSRVRVTDQVDDLTWDRSVIYIPELPCWVVIDTAQPGQSGFRTLSALWWTTDLLARGDDWFETHLRGVMDWSNRKQAALLVALPPVPGQSGEVSALPFRRHFQEEVALARTWTGEQRAGQFVNFVSVLWPHPYDDLDAPRPAALEVIASQPHGRGLGVRLQWQDQEWTLAVLNDLAAGRGQEDVRPTYRAALGKTEYGPIASDAAFACLRRGAGGTQAGLVNGTFFSLEGQALFEAPACGMFQEDRTARPGAAARFRWESE